MARKYRNIRSKSSSRKKKSIVKKVVFWSVFIAVFLLLGKLFLSLSFVSLIKPVSVFSRIVSSSGLESTEGRTNILLLGLDRRLDSEVGGTLTDTIILVSLSPKEQEALLVSLPRDLWVRIEKDYYSKINSAYSYGGVETVKNTVSGVSGLPVHYYAMVDFEGFRKGIDILGGIEVNVEQAFDDYYFPIPGKENALCGIDEAEAAAAEDIEDPDEREREQYKYWCRYEHVHFDAGKQLMDGVTALKYARSRHALGAEGTDFARARRQQKVILAVKDKLLDLNITDFSTIKELWRAGQDAVDTDLDLFELEQLYHIYDKFGAAWEVKTLVIDGTDGEGGFLYAPSNRAPYGGQYVLVPRAGDFSEIQAYVQKLLFGD